MESTEVIERYKSVLFRAKIFSAVTIVLVLPKIVIGISGNSTFLGINNSVSLILFAVGVISYIAFFYGYWKCPSCNEFPGGGWGRKECQHCKVKLKE